MKPDLAHLIETTEKGLGLSVNLHPAGRHYVRVLARLSDAELAALRRRVEREAADRAARKGAEG